ncbi:Putative ribonuclease H protein At1g65750 [Linum perenne]
MTKLAFKFLQELEKRLVRVLQSKYFRETSEGFIPKNKSIQSPLWKRLTGECDTMLRDARSAIRNGKGTTFWTVRWVDSDDTWDFYKLIQFLPQATVNLVMGMTPPQADRGDDDWVWGMEKDGKFSIKSAYHIVCNLGETMIADPWLSVWKWKGPHRAKLFLWLVVHEKILTNVGRKRRKLTDDESCANCPTQSETVLHALGDCKLAMDVWKQLRVFDLSDGTWRLGLQDWICSLLRSDQGVLFGIVCWLIWKARNDRIFSGANQDPSEVVHRASFWARTAEEADGRNNLLLGNQVKRRPTEIAWDPGPPGWVTLNTDGSVDSNRQGTTVGGLIRDDLGRCFLAFTMNLGNCSIKRAELRGAIEGLRLAWRAGYMLLQLDSKAAISLLTETRDTSHQHGMEVLQFRELCDRDWIIKTKHTYREGNHAANLLASLGYGYPLGSHTISTTDSQLVYFLRYDCMGITEQRSILINE